MRLEDSPRQNLQTMVSLVANDATECIFCRETIDINDGCFFPRCRHSSHKVHRECMGMCAKYGFINCVQCHPGRATQTINERLKQNLFRNALLSSLISSGIMSSLARSMTDLSNLELIGIWSAAEALTALKMAFDDYRTDVEHFNRVEFALKMSVINRDFISIASGFSCWYDRVVKGNGNAQGASDFTMIFAALACSAVVTQAVSQFTNSMNPI